MNKSNKIFLLLIIILLIALVVVTFLYLDMRNTAKENLNYVLETAEENSKLNARISELEEKENISTATNMSTSNMVLENEKEQNYSVDTNKVTIEIDENTITPTSISIIITNNNENEIGYGDEFKIQNKINGEWKDLEYLPDTAWNAIAHIIKGNSQASQKLDIEYYYGKLNKGTYRVIKTIFTPNGKNIDIYSNEFEVK